MLNGRTTTAALAADESLGTTGPLHHHLRALVAAGWLASTGRGCWSVAARRVIPLLVVVLRHGRPMNQRAGAARERASSRPERVTGAKMGG